MDTIISYLPAAEGYLPNWLLFVRARSIAIGPSPCPSNNVYTPGLDRLRRQQRASLHLARPHTTSLLRRQRRRRLTRDATERAHVRHLDAAVIGRAPVRCVQYHEQGRLRDRLRLIPGCLCALCQRVARHGQHALGKRVGGPRVG